MTITVQSGILRKQVINMLSPSPGGPGANMEKVVFLSADLEFTPKNKLCKSANTLTGTTPNTPFFLALIFALSAVVD